MSEMSSIASIASSIASVTSFQYNVAFALNSTEYRRRQGFAVDPVADGLQTVDLVEVRAEPFHRLQSAHQRRHLVGHRHEQVRLLDQLGHLRHVTVAEVEQVRDLEHVVDDVVELLGEGVDVLTIERGDEGRVQPLEDVARQRVTVGLAAVHGVRSDGLILQQVTEQTAARDHVCRGLIEQVEEPIVAGNETEPHESRTVVA